MWLVASLATRTLRQFELEVKPKMKNCRKNFSDRVRALRGPQNQHDFAETLGIPQTTYSNFERGAREPGLDLLGEISTRFGVSVDWLLGLSDVRSGGGVQTPPRDADVARLWALVESQQRTIEALAKGGVADAVQAASSAGSRKVAAS